MVRAGKLGPMLAKSAWSYCEWSWARYDRAGPSEGLDPHLALADNDAGGLFRRLGDQVVTGPTGTNLNELSSNPCSGAVLMMNGQIAEHWINRHTYQVGHKSQVGHKPPRRFE